MIQGDDVRIHVSGTLDNTGYLIAHNKLSITGDPKYNLVDMFLRFAPIRRFHADRAV